MNFFLLSSKNRCLEQLVQKHVDDFHVREEKEVLDKKQQLIEQRERKSSSIEIIKSNYETQLFDTERLTSLVACLSVTVSEHRCVKRLIANQI